MKLVANKVFQKMNAEEKIELIRLSFSGYNQNGVTLVGKEQFDKYQDFINKMNLKYQSTKK